MIRCICAVVFILVLTPSVCCTSTNYSSEEAWRRTIRFDDVVFLPNRTVAVFISGLRIRFILGSFVQHVVWAAVRDGFAVHVYLSLLGLDPRRRTYTYATQYSDERILGEADPRTGLLAPHSFDQHVRESIEKAGGELIYYEHLKTEALDELPEGPIFHKRLSQYSPYKSQSGKAILKLWRARELMWNSSVALEARYNAQYRFVLWTRDDAFWPSPIQLRYFLNETDPKTVYGRNCATYGGINDKTVLLGRQAAPQMMTAYSAFFNPTWNLETGNAEQYLLKLAQVRTGDMVPQTRPTVKQVSFAYLPSLDAMANRRTRQICIKMFYACLKTLPPWIGKWCSFVPRPPTNLKKWEEIWPPHPPE